MPDIKPILLRARNLIADPAHWIQGQYASGPIADPFTTCFCTIGAIDRAIIERAGVPPEEVDDDWVILTAEYSEEGKAVLSKLQEILHGRFIADFNDDPETTHADVLNLLDKALEDA